MSIAGLRRWISVRVSVVLALSAGAVVAEDAKPIPYPLDTCSVSGEKLGDMGDPVVKIHEGREVKFCCKGCIKKFDKDPAKYLAEVDAKAKAAPADKGGKPAPGHDGHKH